MLCGKSKTKDEQTSAKIDKKIKKEKKEFKLTHRIPVVGAGESGKSTLIKQMQILYINGFSMEDRQSKIADIRKNIRDALLSITAAMHNINPPVSLEKDENEAGVNYIQEETIKSDFQFNPKFFDIAEKLWKDKGVQTTFSRANEFQLIDSGKYFLDKCSQVAKDDFLPDDQDILRCRVLTSGIFETKFTMNKINFHMFDVGGQREERRKWIQVFHDVTAVIFVCACSAYDMTLREVNTVNRLRESMDLFSEVWNNRFLRQTSMILFLNKQDLFRDKILAGKTKMETFFPEIKDYQYEPENSNKNPDPPDLAKAKSFICNEFLIKSKKNNDGSRRCYPHYTTAVDTENIKRVFSDCQDMLQRVYMQKMGLL